MFQESNKWILIWIDKTYSQQASLSERFLFSWLRFSQRKTEEFSSRAINSLWYYMFIYSHIKRIFDIKCYQCFFLSHINRLGIDKISAQFKHKTLAKQWPKLNDAIPSASPSFSPRIRRMTNITSFISRRPPSDVMLFFWPGEKREGGSAVPAPLLGKWAFGEVKADNGQNLIVASRSPFLTEV